jgi:hypothetical protein
MIKEFEAAIADFERALRTVPDEDWESSVWEVKQTDPWMWPAPGVEPIPVRTLASIQRQSAFWVVAYHCLFFLDQYSAAEFSMPTAFAPARGGPEELPFPAADGAAPLPGSPISREVLLGYLDFGRRQLQERIGQVDMAAQIGPYHPHAGKTLDDLYQVNLNHVREHGGQLLAFAISRAEGDPTSG